MCDTAPIIYFIEDHKVYGAVVDTFFKIIRDTTDYHVFSSVITLAEVLPKPIQVGQINLAKRFSEFLRKGKNLTLIEISADIAEKAGWLRGRYPPASKH